MAQEKVSRVDLSKAIAISKQTLSDDTISDSLRSHIKEHLRKLIIAQDKATGKTVEMDLKPQNRPRTKITNGACKVKKKRVMGTGSKKAQVTQTITIKRKKGKKAELPTHTKEGMRIVRATFSKK
jgi:hypothetical protein